MLFVRRLWYRSSGREKLSMETATFPHICVGKTRQVFHLMKMSRAIRVQNIPEPFGVLH